ncbi:hypothetical protein ACN2CC_18495 [Mesorhizobium muleiense]|uniref:hypothetical protein n=1 Tax=Mesorhizobium muleiense TaxID=1004279 RepID=UPI003AFB68AE
MRRNLAIAAVIAVSIAFAIGCVEIDSVRAKNAEASPIYGVTIPVGYRSWEPGPGHLVAGMRSSLRP